MNRGKQQRGTDGASGQQPGRVTVTVCVSPLRRFGRNSVDRELQQVRSALLYADHVRLVSTTVAMLETFRPLLTISTDDPWDAVRRLPNVTIERMFDTKSVKSVRKDLARLTQLRRDDYRRNKLESEFLPGIRSALRQATDVYDAARTPELDLARRAGALTVEVEQFELDDKSEEHRAWFRRQLLSAWEDPTGTVLLDDRAQRSVRASRPDASHAPAVMSRAKRATTGTELVKRLPTFPTASMTDVLEVRGELSSARKQYRSVVRDLSDKLASTALDPSLTSEVGELWRDTVEPVLEDMTRTVSISKLARGTGRRLFGDAAAKLKSGGVITATVSALQYVNPPSAGVVGGASLYLVGTALQEAVEERRRAQAHEFVYLGHVANKLRR